MNTLKAAFHYRQDFHTEQNDHRPTSPVFNTTEPWQHQNQTTWSAALEDTFHVTPDVDLVGASAMANIGSTGLKSTTT